MSKLGHMGEGDLPFPLHTRLRDTTRQRVGELMGGIVQYAPHTGKVVGQTLFLRPPGGGCEWDAAPEDLEPDR